MTKIMDRVIGDIQTLSSSEKNTVMRCLVSSLDEVHDDDATQEWAELSKNRLEDITSSKVQAKSWDEIKKEVLS